MSSDKRKVMAAEAWEEISKLFGAADGQIFYDALISGKIPHVTCEWCWME